MAKSKAVSVQLVGGKPTRVLGKPSAVVLDEDTAKSKKIAETVVPTIRHAFEGLMAATDGGVLTDEQEYRAADVLFGRVKAARKTWAGRMEEIIRPIADGLQKLYKLNRDIDRPMAVLENEIEQAMKAYKLAEARRIRLEAEQVEAERLRLEAKKETLTRPAAIERVEAELETVEAWVPETVVGQHSAARMKKKVRIVDVKAFARGVADGLIPENCLMVHMPTININYRDDAESVAAWPGVEEFDDVDIVSR
jgi:hypothetical protein